MNRAALISLGLSVGLMLTSGQVSAAPTPAGTSITNVAYMDVLTGDPQHPTVDPTPSPPVTITVEAVCGVTITPALQSLQSPVGINTPFTFLVHNTGNGSFTFPLTATPVSADTITSVDPQSITLGQDESQNITLNVLSTTPGTHTAKLTTSCADGSSQATGTANLDNTRQPVTINKVVNTAQALPGDTVTYTLTVHNPNSVDVQNVTVQDPLPPELTFISSNPAPDSYDSSTNLLKYTTSIPAGGDSTITVQAKITKLKDAMHIVNIASAYLPGDQPTKSPPATTNIWDGKLSISKDVDQRTAVVGQRVNYTVIVTNDSINAAFKKTHVVDMLPVGLKVDDNTLKLNGVTVTDLNPDPQVIEVDGPAMQAHDTLKLTYSAVITPLANGTLTNTVYATGTPDSPTPLPDVKSPNADATVVVMTPQRATLIGRVWLDRNQDKKYDTGTDTPVANARIMIAGIGSVITDSKGRYGIPDLRAGRYGMQLQTADLGGDPESKGGDYGLLGARIADVWDLSVVDFPLIPPVADLYAQRITRVYGGGLNLVKSVTRLSDQPQNASTGDQYRADIVLTNEGDSPLNIKYADVLPAGVTLDDGQSINTSLSLKPGESQNLSYTFSGLTTPEARVTDPEVTVSITQTTYVLPPSDSPSPNDVNDTTPSVPQESKP